MGLFSDLFIRIADKMGLKIQYKETPYSEDYKESEKITRESNFYQDLGAELNDVENVMRLLDQEWETDTYYKAENVQTVGDVIDILLTNRRHSRRGEDPLR